MEPVGNNSIACTSSMSIPRPVRWGLRYLCRIDSESVIVAEQELNNKCTFKSNSKSCMGSGSVPRSAMVQKKYNS